MDITKTPNFPPNAPQETGRQTCKSTVKQEYAGIQVGYDLAKLNIEGTKANLHAGLTTGYISAKTRDVTAAGSYFSEEALLIRQRFIDPASTNGTLNTPEGTLRTHTDVPFVGAYIALTQQGLYFDAQLRWDFYQSSLTDPNNGLRNQSLDMRGVSLTVNAGQNIPLGSGWFVERRQRAPLRFCRGPVIRHDASLSRAVR